MRLGIRAQLLLSIGAVLVVALMPLVLVVERLTEANLRQIWEAEARSLGRSVASHIAEARQSRGDHELDGLIEAELGSVAGVGLYDAEGRLLRVSGRAAGLPREIVPSREEARSIESASGPAMIVIVPGKASPVGVLLAAQHASFRATPVVRLVALYIGLIGATLLLLTHVVLTRFVIRPVKRLSAAALRVVDGQRDLDLDPSRGGASELIELGTSLSRMTDKLREDERELLRTIADVRAAKEQLERAQETVVRSERLASVGRLAAGLAHEIGNPLAAISSFQELLQDSPNLDDEERDFLARMSRETERVHRVLRDLLDFARPSQALAYDDSSSARGDVAEAVRHAVKLVKPQRAFRNVELASEVPDELPQVTLASDRIEQVLLNLLLNAADACESGGAASVRAEAEGNLVRLVVEDDGGGVADAVASQLFEPFVSTKEVGKGTGLGLAVCRGLVEAAGGSIRHEPTERGARFVVELPAVVREADSSAAST